MYAIRSYYGSNLLQVSMSGTDPTYLTMSDLNKLKEEPTVYGVTGIVSRTVSVTAGVEDGDYSVEGVTSSYQQITGQVIDLGRFVCDIDVEAHAYNAVVGTDVADELFGTKDCIGNTLEIRGYDSYNFV